MSSLKDRIASIEDMVARLCSFFLSQEPDGYINREEYWGAIREAREGNGRPLQEYLKKGGRVPK